MTASKQSQDGTACSSILTLPNVQWKTPDDGMEHPDCLEAVIKNLHETYQCRILMMGKEVAQNMYSFVTE